MRRYSLLVLGLAIGIAVLALLLMSPQAKAWQSGDTYPGTGSWTVSNPTILADQALVVPGNITVNGQLTLYNATLRINSASDGLYTLNVSSGGNLSVYRSLLTASSATLHYRFTVYGDLHINESNVTEMWGDKASWVGGIQLYSDHTQIENSNITLGSVGGISIWNCSARILSNNISGNGATGSTTYCYGIYVKNSPSTNCEIKGNRIQNNTFVSGTARYGYGIRSEYQPSTDVISNNTIADNGFTTATTPNGYQLYLYYSNVRMADNNLFNGRYQIYAQYSNPPEIQGGTISTYVNLTTCYQIYATPQCTFAFRGTLFTATNFNQSFYVIYAYTNCQLDLTDCRFDYPVAGPGTLSMYMVYIGAYSPLNVTNCTFNVVNSPSIYMIYAFSYSPVNVTGCTFTATVASNNYGIYSATYSPMNLRRCKIDFRDTLMSTGLPGTGVVSCVRSMNSALLVEDCTLSMRMDYLQFYGIYAQGVDGIVRNVTFTVDEGNSASRKWSYGIWHPGASGMSSSIDPSAKAGGTPGKLLVENCTGTASTRCTGLYGLMWLSMGSIELNMRNCSFKSTNGAGLNAMGAFQFFANSMVYINDSRFDLDLGGGSNSTPSTFYPISLADIKFVDLFNTTVNITFIQDAVDLPLAYLEGKCGELSFHGSRIDCRLDAPASSVTLFRFMRLTSGVPSLANLVMDDSAFTLTATREDCALGFLHLWMSSSLASSDMNDAEVSLTLTQPSSRTSFAIDMYRVKSFGLRNLTVDLNAPASSDTVIIGFRLQLSSPLMENLTIQGNGEGNIVGFSCDLVSRPTIVGCTVNSCALGLSSSFYSKPDVHDTTFSNLQDGLSLDLAGNATLTGCLIASSGTSVSLTGASWATLIDTSLSGASTDFELNDSSTAWVLNCSFDPSATRFLDGLSSLVVNWWLSPSVTWQNGAGIIGANLVLRDLHGTEVLRASAGAGGALARLPVTQYIQTRGVTELLGPYSGQATYQALLGERIFHVNASQETAVIIIDDALPSLLVVEPADGHIQGFTLLTLKGTASDRGSGLAYMQFSYNGVDWYRIPGTARWEYALDVPEGEYNFQVRAVDVAGNEYTVALDIAIDLTAPFIDMDSPADGSTLNTIAVRLTGRVEPRSRLTINFAPVTLAADGTFSFPVSLIEGSNTFSLFVQDRAGNTNSSSLSVFLDITPPQLQLLTPADRLITNVSGVLVTGFADPGSTVFLNDIIPLTLGADGSFSYMFGLAPGANVIRVTASDAAGNRVSASRTVFFDDSLGLALTGTGNNILTNRSAFTVRGMTDPDATLRLNGGLLTVGPDGSFQVTYSLAEGLNMLSFEARDPAGNRRSLTISVILDTEPPAIEIITPAPGSVSRTQQVQVRGICEPGITLTVNGQAVDAVDGNFTAQLTFDEGTHDIVVEGRDAAGNRARCSVTLSVDLTAPALDMTAPAAGFRTGDPTMQVSGSAEPGSEVTVNGIPVAVAPDGSFHALVNTGKGQTSITVTATDGAGNSATRTLHAVGVGEPAPAPKSPWSGTWSLAGQLLALASLVLLSALAMDVVRRRRATSRRE